ncbi:MAG: glycosyltransferase family 39 protein [Candidatus Levybacteria bacterium]|nr:glycosyltransferase family 39 protein [Candidatus Levybacteria bacterium]
MKKHTEYLLLFIVVIVAATLRLWQLGNIPSSPDWDEVALGYNAYSIMQTGRDEYGKFLPIVLRSFDDYKPALYAYLSIPAIIIFGLNEFAVRLPSATFGILTVLATFFLVRELFKKDNIALLSSFLLAISPWHIQFSRIAFESNVGLAFNSFAVLFFLWGLKKPWILVMSSIVMALNLYVYQSEKVFTPLLFVLLVIYFRKQLFLISKKYLIMAFLLGLFVSLPMIHYTFTNREALSRAQDVSILTNKAPDLAENVVRLMKDRERNDILGLILDNRRVTYFKNIASGYLSHFDLNWLFIEGDIARHHAPSMGLLYIFEFPFLLIGIHMLLFGAFPRKTKLLIFGWFLIAPIPASVTSDVPHAVRTLNFLPTFQIFTAIGLISTISLVSNIKYKILSMKIRYITFVFFFFFFAFNFSYYINQYFVQQNYFHAKYWQYGYKEAVEFLMPVQNKYNKIIVANTQPLDQSYIFFLFYSKYDPSKYLADGGTKSGILEEDRNKFLNFEFRPFTYYTEESQNILLVGSSSDFKEIFKTIKRIDYPNGEVAIRIVHKD